MEYPQKMQRLSKLIYLLLVLLLVCISNKSISQKQSADFKLDTLSLLDKTRNRVVTLAIYAPRVSNKNRNCESWLRTKQKGKLFGVFVFDRIFGGSWILCGQYSA